MKITLTLLKLIIDLANLYSEQAKYGKAEEYYKKALKYLK